MIEKILNSRHYAYSTEKADKVEAAYCNAYLLSNFGIIVDRPEYVGKEVVKAISASYRLNVPASFYRNPQDTMHFTASELLVEQLVSYFIVECTGNGAIDEENPDKYARFEVFKKDLPEYVKGDELVLREFKVLTTEAELDAVLNEITANYCAYTRPFGEDELAEFKWLFDNGYYDNQKVCCKDNAISMLDRDITFARFLDKKDLVKMSVDRLGDKKQLTIDNETRNFYRACLKYVHDCPLSKRQAKYFNKVVQAAGVDAPKATNAKSPFKAATIALNEGNVIEAAKIYAKNGSLLERNVKMLLSRANPFEAVQILDMIPAKNPIALYQMVSQLASDNGSARTFTFTRNKKLHKHIETDYEQKWRKSVLNDSTRKYLHDACFDKIDSYYSSLESLGKVYVADNFYKLGVPTNTSAGGKGIDTLPAGSRVKLASSLIRSFVYWNDVFDIDASLTLLRDDGKTDFIYFGNYAELRGTDLFKAVKFSGDCRDENGAEYYDIDLNVLEALGYKTVLFHFNGFAGRLNGGDINCGYQVKTDFMTEAWDPKNIAMQIHVNGDSSAALGFAIDVKSQELVVINQMLESSSRVMNPNDLKAVEKLIDGNFLELNMGRIVSHRGEIVSTPEEADVIFDDLYKPADGQTVVRSYELEKLVGYANA